MLKNKKIRLIVLLPFVALTAAGCSIFGIGGGGGGPLGVLKTIDGGATWHGANAVEGEKNGTIAGVNVAEMMFNPNSASSIYLGTVDQGLIASTNSADTWKQLLSKVGVYDFFINSKDSKTIYACGAYNGHGRVVRTKDGGQTWEEMFEEASNNNNIHTCTVNPANDQELYAGLDSGEVIKSVDGGVHWFVVYDFKDVPMRIRYNRLNNSMYALLSAGGIDKSTDGGQTWTKISSAIGKQSTTAALGVTLRTPSQYQRMALDDQTAGVIYVTSDAGLFKTTDDGKTWLYLNVPSKTTDTPPFAVASTKGGVVVYTSVANTIFKSLDGGQSWQTQELPTTAIVSRIIVDPNNPQTAYAGLISQ